MVMPTRETTAALIERLETADAFDHLEPQDAADAIDSLMGELNFRASHGDMDAALYMATYWEAAS